MIDPDKLCRKCGLPKQWCRCTSKATEAVMDEAVKIYAKTLEGLNRLGLVGSPHKQLAPARLTSAAQHSLARHGYGHG